MTQIKNPPNEYDFGYDFNYSLWTAGTEVSLVNVPWNNDYRDVVKFANKAALNTYIDGLEPAGIRIEQLSYLKPNAPVRLNIPHNRANRYNYLRASNPLQPVAGDIVKDFYYYILDTKYVAPNTTELVLQLDVWQTYGYDVTYGRCYVERGHIGIANANQFNNNGRDHLTVPEGLDLGTDYQIYSRVQSRPIFAGEDVLVISTTDLRVNPGTTDNPVLMTAPGSKIMGLPSGASAYLFYNITAFKEWMRTHADTPWLTQGIISVTLLPEISKFNDNYSAPPSTNDPYIIDGLGMDQKPLKVAHRLSNNWRDTYPNQLPTRYRHLLKFMVSPYTILEATTFTGSTLIIRPELWNSDHATFVQRISILPPNQRVMFWPFGYNGKTVSADPADQANVFIDAAGEQLAMAVGVTNFPTFPVVNNMAISYLASNSASLAWQNDSADWSQQKALASAQAGYDVASGSMSAASDLANIGIGADTAQTGVTNQAAATQAGIQAASSIIGGFAGGAAFGPQGALGGVLAGGAQGLATVAGSAVQQDANRQSLGIRNTTARSTVDRQNQQAGLVRDTNKNLADWSARGDYANTIAGINAKVRDAKMTQPSMSGSFGGDAFNIVNGYDRLELRFKTVDLATVMRIGDFWLRYGYAVQRFIQIPQNLKCMSKFTYWKLQETYIKSSFVPEGFKQAIRGILEKGVTVWSNPDDIGVIDIADNEPLTGIAY